MGQNISLPLRAASGASTRTAAGMKKSRWLPWGLAAIILLGYSLVLAVNHSEGEDSGHYIDVIRNTDLGELFYANHILFASFNWVLYKIWQLLGYGGDPALPIQMANVAAAAVTVFLLFHVARRLGLDDLYAAICVGLTATTFGFWWYSVEAETYLLPLPFILLCVWLLLGLAERGFTTRRFLALGCCFSLATLFHQQHVLLMPILIFAAGVIWYRRRRTVSRTSLLAGLAAFGAVSAMMIGTTYFAVAILVQDCSTLGEIIHWSKGTAQQGLWTPWSAANPIKSIVGIGRAICGLHFLYGFEFFQAGIARIQPGKFLADDRFLAESISPAWRGTCLGTAALAAVSGLAVAWACIFPLGRGSGAPADLRTPRLAFAAFAAGTLIAYSVFNTLWEPQNVEFWVMLFPVVSLVVARRLADRQTPRWATAAALTLIGSLFVTNLLGSVLPQTDRRGDYWYAANRYLIRHATADDLIVTDGGWISDNCLRSNTPAAVVVVSQVKTDELAQTIRQHRRGRIFISSWALKPDQAIVATAPQWERDEAALARLFGRYRPRLKRLHDNGFQAVWELPQEGSTPPRREHDRARRGED